MPSVRMGAGVALMEKSNCIKSARTILRKLMRQCVIEEERILLLNCCVNAGCED